MSDRVHCSVMRAMRAAAVGACLVAAAAVPAAAQTKVGTSIGQFLLIEPSARFAGMGNTGATAFGDVMSAYYNPASIARMDKYAGQFTHALWFADINYDHIAMAIPLGGDRGNLSASITSLNSGEIPVRSVIQPLGTGERFRVSDIAFAVGYGKRVTHLFSLGIPSERVRVVSYGKEFPFEQGHDEAAWSKNRRAHFVLTGK